MKKILCFVLAVLPMLSACIFSTFAAENERCFSDEFYLERFEKTMNRLGCSPDEPYIWDEQFTEWMVNKKEEAVEYTLLSPIGLVGPPKEGYMRVGKYVITFSDYAPFYNPGIYTYIASEDEIYTLTEAYEMGVKGISAAFDFLAQKGRCAVAGDADLDGKLNVKDATAIQKQLVGLVPSFSDDVKDNLNDRDGALYYAVKDFNLDENVNIKDATAIQKYIAGIELQ